MATFRDQTADDAAAGGVFFSQDGSGDPDEFNEEVDFYPKWDRAQKVTTRAHVIRDEEEGTREVRGDGVTVNAREGRSIRRSIKIECPASLDVRETQPETNPDMFLIDSELWVVKRITGRDTDLQTVLCVHREHNSIRNENRVG